MESFVAVERRAWKAAFLLGPHFIQRKAKKASVFLI
jgi:hypothetical protein